MATGFCYFVAAALRHTVKGKKKTKSQEKQAKTARMLIEAG